MDRCPSGLWCWFRKPVGVKVPWVQIPPYPPNFYPIENLDIDNLLFDIESIRNEYIYNYGGWNNYQKRVSYNKVNVKSRFKEVFKCESDGNG